MVRILDGPDLSLFGLRPGSARPDPGWARGRRGPIAPRHPLDGQVREVPREARGVARLERVGEGRARELREHRCALRVVRRKPLRQGPVALWPAVVLH